MQIKVLWRENWHLLTLLGVMLIVLGLGLLRALFQGDAGTSLGETQRQGGSGRVQQAQESSGNGPQRDSEALREILEREPGPQPPDEATETRNIIASYQAAYDADPDAPDAPNHLLAIGHLYLQRLENHEAAAQFYELLLFNYPDWEKTPTVYDKLWTCYETLGDVNSILRLAELIQERHPEDTDLNRIAQEMLGERVEVEQDTE